MKTNNYMEHRSRAEQSCNTKLTLPSRVRTWSFTLNNHTTKEVEQWHTDIQEFKIKKFRMQEEIGKNGTPHLQGAVTFKNTVRLYTVKNLLPRAHWEPAKNTEALYKYCRKVDTRSGLEWEWEDVTGTKKGHGLNKLEIAEHMLNQRLNHMRKDLDDDWIVDDYE